MSWPTAQLQDVAEFFLGKMLDRRKNKGDLLPYLANLNVRWGRFDLDNLRTMRFEQHELDRYGLKAGDIVMCEGGEPGRCALWRGQRPAMMFQKALHRIRPTDHVSNEFLYYNLFNRARSGRLAPLFTGATIKHLPREKLAKVEVDVPPRNLQDRVVSILTAYDALIENNRRRIQLLEQAAHLLYKEWFVHLRFPHHESVPVVDGLPEGWRRIRLEAVSTITMGQSPKSRFYNREGKGLPFHQGVRGFRLRFPVHSVYSTAGNRYAEEGDILFSVRAPVGRLNIAQDKLIVGRGIAGIRARVAHHQAFLYYALKNFFAIEDRIGTGTVFAAIRKRELQRIELHNPPENLVRRFTAIATPIDRQIATLNRSTRSLTQARDLLLPRLMNGEISI